MQLFKYVPMERFDILENELIRFSSASALNDPWEMKPHVDQFLSDAMLTQMMQQDAKKENPIVQDEEDFRQFWKVRRKRNPGLSKKKARLMFEQFKQQNPHALPLTKRAAETYALAASKRRDPQYIQQFLQRFEELGVLSLTEEPNNLLMWAHYCNGHKGFIFELDHQHSFFTQLKKHDPVKAIRPIVYAKKLPHLNNVEDILEDNNGLDAMLFTKDERWSYEREWRLVADFRDATLDKELPDGEIAWLYRLPADCIKRVVLGCLMSQNNKDKITHFLRTDSRYKNTWLQQAVRIPREYNLKFVDLSLNHSSLH